MHMQCQAFTLPGIDRADISRHLPASLVLLTRCIHHDTSRRHIYRILISCEPEPTSLASLSLFSSLSLSLLPQQTTMHGNNALFVYFFLPLAHTCTAAAAAASGAYTKDKARRSELRTKGWHFQMTMRNGGGRNFWAAMSPWNNIVIKRAVLAIHLHCQSLSWACSLRPQVTVRCPW